MKAIVRTFNETTNTLDSLLYEDVKSINILEVNGCFVIVYEGGTKTKYIPDVKLHDIDLVDIIPENDECDCCCKCNRK